MRRIVSIVFVLSFILGNYTCLIAAEKVVVVPLNSNRTPVQATAFAWGAFGHDCTEIVNSSYGVTSCSHDSTGNYTITQDNYFLGWPVVVTPYTVDNDPYFATVRGSSNTNSFIVQTRDEAGVAEDESFNFIVFATLDPDGSAKRSNTDTGYTETRVRH